MANRVQSAAILSLLMILVVGVRAQSPQPTPQDPNAKAGTSSKAPEGKTIPPQRVTNLQGFGTTGRIPKFGGGDFLVNSLIFESFTGKIGIGTQTPGSTLSVNGQIETLSGGVKFPDGTVQTTAGVSNALTAVAHDATLTGEGTVASPLRVASAEFQRQPFATGKTGSLGGGFGLNILLTQVPSDKLLVIEQVTANCGITPGQQLEVLSIQTRHEASSPTSHHLITSRVASIPFLVDVYASSQNVRLYAAPGTNVRLMSSGIVGGGSCDASISGYFVDQP